MSKVMSKAELMAEGKLKTEIVPMGDDKHVVISEVPAIQYATLWGECASEPDDKGDSVIDMQKFNALLLANSIVDDKGERMFSDEDAPLLAKFGQESFRKMMEVAKKLNGLMGDEGNDSGATKDA